MGKEPVSIYIRQWACFTHKTLSLFCSIFLPQHPKPVQLPLEVPDHSPGHLDPLDRIDIPETVDVAQEDVKDTID